MSLDRAIESLHCLDHCRTVGRCHGHHRVRHLLHVVDVILGVTRQCSRQFRHLAVQFLLNRERFLIGVRPSYLLFLANRQDTACRLDVSHLVVNALLNSTLDVIDRLANCVGNLVEDPGDEPRRQVGNHTLGNGVSVSPVISTTASASSPSGRARRCRRPAAERGQLDTFLQFFLGRCRFPQLSSILSQSTNGVVSCGSLIPKPLADSVGTLRHDRHVFGNRAQFALHLLEVFRKTGDCFAEFGKRRRDSVLEFAYKCKNPIVSHLLPAPRCCL